MTLPWLIGLFFRVNDGGRPPAFARFRWTLLRALRAAYHGELLKIGPTCIHNGAPAEPAITAFIVERGFVLPQPSPWAKNITQLVLSELGHRILVAGEDWWSSLSFPQRFYIALTE